QLYFKYRPARVLLVADADAATHRAFRLPAIAIVEDDSATSWPLSATMGQLQAGGVNPTGAPPAPHEPFPALVTLSKRDAFGPTGTDQQIVAAAGTQLAGHFLIDRDGIIRCQQIEAAERIGALSKFPSDEEILRAARSL